jgi:IPT/TIG domain
MKVATRLAALAAAAVLCVAAPAQAHGFGFPDHGRPICAAGASFSAVADTPFNSPVATFRVDSPFATAWHFHAFIAWGDGTRSFGTITAEPSGQFVVSGSHTYSGAGTFYTTIFIFEHWGPRALVHGRATVAPQQPWVTSVKASSGPTAGGNSVTITGTYLTGATDVEFGSTPATDVTVDSPTQITATAPPGSTGTVDVTVTTPGGTSSTSYADQYTYASVPTISSLSPASGPTAGGTVVTIAGTDLIGATDVEFGSTPATSFTVEGPTQITATAPPGSTGTVDVTVTTPGGASPTSGADQYTYAAVPTISGISPSSGPPAGGTSVTISGTDLSGASDVEFGGTLATSFTRDSATQITANSPAGAGTVDVTVTTPGGTSTTGAADLFSYVAPAVVQALVQPTGSPTVVTNQSTVQSNVTASLAGTVNPQGLPTSAHFEYGLDSKYTNPSTSGPVYDQSTPEQPIGSDFDQHAVSVPVTGLVPNALYHARLVATNGDGTTFGPDVRFTTPAGPLAAPPALGSSFNVAPVSGLVLIQQHGAFVPLTEVHSIRPGTVINTLKGTLKLITATGQKHKTQTGTFGGAVFKVTQIGNGQHRGLTTIALAEGGFKGAPSYATCKVAHGKQASVAAVSKKVLQLLHSTDHHGSFRTKGKYSAATVRGTDWTMADGCDGTLTHVIKDSVVVNDFVRHISVVLHAGQSYLALAKPKKHK